MIKEISDKTEVIDFLKKYFDSYAASDDPFEKIVVYDKNNIIGAVAYSIIYERAEINYIVVADDYRREGIASKLLEYALNDIEKSSCDVVSLEVNVTNKAAINLYLKKGFEIKAIREKYYDDNDGYLMVKNLEV